MECTRHCQMVREQHSHDRDLETRKKIKVLQEMNAKHNLHPNIGVDKLKKEQNQALKDHVKDIMACFWAKSHNWTAHGN